MKKTFFLVLFTTILSFAHAQQVFPNLQCETLNSKKLTIPEDVLGKRTVIGLAFSPKADKTLKAWAQPIYNALMADGMGGMMGGNMYNANICFVGMLRGIARLGLNEMKQRSRENIEKKLHDYFMISEQDVNNLCDELGIKEKNIPHFFVLDETGKIIFHTSGEYSDNKLNQITEKLLE